MSPLMKYTELTPSEGFALAVAMLIVLMLVLAIITTRKL